MACGKAMRPRCCIPCMALSMIEDVYARADREETMVFDDGNEIEIGGGPLGSCTRPRLSQTTDNDKY